MELLFPNRSSILVTDMTGKTIAPVTEFVKEGTIMRNVAVVVRQNSTRRKAAASPIWPVEPPARDNGTATVLWSATIRGEPTPRARMHDVVVTDGVARLIKSRPARLWQNAAMAQLLNRRPHRPLTKELGLECRIWSSAPRNDLDDALLIEALERAAIIASGRQIREKHLFAGVDRDDPRLMVRLVRFGDAS